jgi:geranylgeranyl reductase family protein
VIGAGPAGSLTAYHLADRGASVLLLDRSRFPRDKPCGGALSGRAVRLLPFSVEPVVEDVFDHFELRLRYGPSFRTRTTSPPAVLTQRRRLDAFLSEQAAGAGADFREGVKVTQVEVDDGGATVEVDGRPARARVVIAADGANGVAARALGLGVRSDYGVALEGNLPYEELDSARYRGCVILEIGTVPGGYGWIFPKGEHVNVGVWGWEREGPKLREHLDRLCRAHGSSGKRLLDVRGHRLPMARPGASVLARGRGLAVGDAAGLVDPVSGDGMYEAFLSARLASEAVADLLAGLAPGLEGYGDAVKRRLAQDLSTSSAAQVVLDRFPLLVFALVRVPAVRHAVEGVFRGDTHLPGAKALLRAGLTVLAWAPRRGAATDNSVVASPAARA